MLYILASKIPEGGMDEEIKQIFRQLGTTQSSTHHIQSYNTIIPNQSQSLQNVTDYSAPNKENPGLAVLPPSAAREVWLTLRQVLGETCVGVWTEVSSLSFPFSSTPTT